MFASAILRSAAAVNAQVATKQAGVTLKPTGVSYVLGLYAKKVPVIFMWAATVGSALFWPLGAEAVCKKLGCGTFGVHKVANSL